MLYYVLGFTFDFVGKFLLGVTVLLVHLSIEKERKIDKPVLRVMKREMIVGVLGLVFITAGFIMHMLDGSVK
jgi:hypothetical protein